MSDGAWVCITFMVMFLSIIGLFAWVAWLDR